MPALHLLVDRARPSASRERAPIDEDHPQRPINTYGETKLAIERALPHFERAYGIRSVALRYFNAAGADPDGVHRRGSRARGAPDPARHRRRARRPSRWRSSATTIRRPTAPACATTSTSSISPTRTCWRSAHLQGGGASRAYNLGIGRPFSVREVLHAVERGRRHSRCRTRWGRGGRAIRRVLYASTRPHPARARLGAGASPISDHRRHRLAVAPPPSRRLLPAARPRRSGA